MTKANFSLHKAWYQAFDALTKIFRKEVHNQGIKVCSVYSEGVDTSFLEANRPECLAAEDVVKAILYVAELVVLK